MSDNESENTYQAWISDFCEPVELPEVLENRIVDCKYFVGDLQTLLVPHWSTRCNQSVDEGLWKVLSDNGLSHKVLISVLYSFIDSGDKEVELTISSIPCCFKKLWMFCDFGLVKWKRRERRNEATGGGRKAKTRQGKSNDHEDMEAENVAVAGSDDDDDDDDCDNDDDNDYLYGHMSTEEAKASIKDKLLSLMQDAVKLLHSYSLKDSEQDSS
ncbi:PREDICTED: uncharacterized protein LOC107329327 [Acropora digitifera]|uniref:uncharacterized protein LOC107329327 n=1 Tax=Acropora digitifera TaxID=70779 RepID=UPI00077A27D6|nr:PREDICTED: uncharacterized protein LOC107329327 [Acropora digitifera]